MKLIIYNYTIISYVIWTSISVPGNLLYSTKELWYTFISQNTNSMKPTAGKAACSREYGRSQFEEVTVTRGWGDMLRGLHLGSLLPSSRSLISSRITAIKKFERVTSVSLSCVDLDIFFRNEEIFKHSLTDHCVTETIQLSFVFGFCRLYHQTTSNRPRHCGCMETWAMTNN